MYQGVCKNQVGTDEGDSLPPLHGPPLAHRALLGRLFNFSDPLCPHRSLWMYNAEVPGKYHTIVSYLEQWFLNLPQSPVNWQVSEGPVSATCRGLCPCVPCTLWLGTPAQSPHSPKPGCLAVLKEVPCFSGCILGCPRSSKIYFGISTYTFFGALYSQSTAEGTPYFTICKINFSCMSPSTGVKRREARKTLSKFHNKTKSHIHL